MDNLSESARADDTLRRRSKLTLAIAALFASQAVFFSGLQYVIGSPVASWIVGTSTVFLLGAPAVVRRDGAVGSRFVMAIIATVLWSVSCFNGGSDAGALYWTAVVPILSMVTDSIRAGVVWAALCVVVPIAMAVAERFGVQFTEIAPEYDALMRSATIVMLVPVLASLGAVYERLLRSTMDELRRGQLEMRFLLDHVDQGFVGTDAAGLPNEQRSGILDRWFGSPAPGETMSQWFGRSSAEFGELLELGLEEAFAGVLPTELALDQLPRHLEVSEHHFDVRYVPIQRSTTNSETDGPLTHLVVVVSDATERVHAERAETAQQEVSAFFGHLNRDRAGATQFFDEARSLVERLRPETPDSFRLVHTLKGNAALFGLRSVVAICHQVESSAQAEIRALSPDEIQRVRDAWSEAAARLEPMLPSKSELPSITETDLVAIEDAVRQEVDSRRVLHMLRGLRQERASVALSRLATQTRALASRLARCPVRVQVDAPDLRLEPAQWKPVLSALVHATRNTIDHGTEPAEVRRSQGKREEMSVHFGIERDASGITLTMSEDGAGIDWERMRVIAQQAGLPYQSHSDLQAALFYDGITTRENATETSGRGVGMSALRDAVRAAKGTLEIDSERGVGTKLTIFLPNPIDVSLQQRVGACDASAERLT